MGSLAAADASTIDSVVPKSESLQDGYSTSTTSSSEAEPEVETGAAPQDVVPVQKRKGGRKPVSTLSCQSSHLHVYKVH